MFCRVVLVKAKPVAQSQVCRSLCHVFLNVFSSVFPFACSIHHIITLPPHLAMLMICSFSSLQHTTSYMCNLTRAPPSTCLTFFWLFFLSLFHKDSWSGQLIVVLSAKPRMAFNNLTLQNSLITVLSIVIVSLCLSTNVLFCQAFTGQLTGYNTLTN